MVTPEPASGVVIAYPYRPNSREREANLACVRAHMKPLGWPDMLVDTAHARFNRAAARNKAVQAAGENVVVICDADTLPDLGAIAEAAEACRTTGMVHLPYTRLKALDQFSSKRYRSGNYRNQRYELDIDWACGSVYVTTAAAWWAVGGQDERFTGWGYEDTAMMIAHRTLLGPMPRHEGTVLQLWHPIDPRNGDPDHDAGVIHYQSYLAADGQPDQVKALVHAQANIH